mmetsp:Transcript_20815/g.39681  ORF Transcript_20815/g.39681 Transcript_20815/m.39681 type:complete len:269 (-) Transcript_20815:47-853(-)
MTVQAGRFTTSADPLHAVNTMQRHASEPSPSAMPGGHFPAGKVTFRLATPAQVGIGIMAGEFRQPEQPAYDRMAIARAGHFARGPGGFDRYCHMQQKARMIVPSLPMQSRVDELHRTSSYAKRFEAQRFATLQNLQQSDERRMARLRQAKTLLQTKSLSQDLSKKLQLSCSLAEIRPEPCGELSPTMQLLNRRVDINRLKHCRTQLAKEALQENAKQANFKPSEMKAVVSDIDKFETQSLANANKHESLMIDTLVDWKSEFQALNSQY